MELFGGGVDITKGKDALDAGGEVVTERPAVVKVIENVNGVAAIQL